MPLVLLDTNLLLYPLDANYPDKQTHAIEVLRQMESNGQGCLSVQSLAEFFRVATGKFHLQPAEIYTQIQILQASFPVFNLTPQIVLEAARGVRDYRLAYYDAQIWASARLNQVPFIFSEDFQDGQTLEGVRFVNPFTARFILADWS
jgi:predicted nucleic acid-binding protein